MAGTYQPMRETLHELNQLMIDQQHWGAQQKAREAEMGLQRMQLNSQMQLQQQQMNINKEKEARALEAMTPKTVNVHKWIPNTYENRVILYNKDGGQAATDIASVFGNGTRIDEATGDLVDAGGNPIQLNDVEMGRYIPTLFAAAERHNDPVFQAEQTVSHLGGQIAAIDKQIKAFPKGDQRFAARRVGLLAKKNALEGTIRKHQKSISPQYLHKTYSEKLENLKRLGMQAAQRGAGPEQMQLIMKSIDDTADRLKQAEKMLMTPAEANKKENLVKMAMEVDARGDIVPNSSVWIPVNKNAAGAMKPGNIDPRFPRHVWAEEITGRRSQSSGGRGEKQSDDPSTKVVSILKSQYQWDKEKEMFVTEENAAGYNIAMALAPEFIKKAKDNPEYTQADAAQDARLGVVGVVKDYFEDRSDIDQRLARQELTQAEYNREIAQLNNDYMMAYGAVPLQEMLPQ